MQRGSCFPSHMPLPLSCHMESMDTDAYQHSTLLLGRTTKTGSLCIQGWSGSDGAVGKGACSSCHWNVTGLTAFPLQLAISQGGHLRTAALPSPPLPLQ